MLKRLTLVAVTILMLGCVSKIAKAQEGKKAEKTNVPTHHGLCAK